MGIFADPEPDDAHRRCRVRSVLRDCKFQTKACCGSQIQTWQSSEAHRTTMPENRSRSKAAIRITVGAATLSVVAASMVEAQQTVPLYQATTITTGSDTRYRAKGIADCLREVLVKVSGEPRLFKDTRIEEMIKGADTYVASYIYRDLMEGIHHHDDQGTYDRPFDLTVQFDPHRVDAALRGLGELPWAVERPTLVPMILVRGFDRPFLLSHHLSLDLTADDPIISEQRESLTNVSTRYGVRIRFPSERDLAAFGASKDGFPTTKPAVIAQHIYVSGILEFRLQTFGWVGTWQMQWRDVHYEWRVDGVSYDQAFDNLVAGAVRILSGHGPPL